jgi:hypothetical protein
LLLTVGSTSTPSAPSGWTAVSGPTVAYRTLVSTRTLVAGDTSVNPGGTATDTEVAVYRGVAGVGSHTYNAATANNVGGASFPLKCSALDGVTGPAMTKTDGSSWVACMGADQYASTNANQMVFDSNTTNRSASLPDAHIGIADSNAGVASWATVGWPGDNFPLPGTHNIAVHTIELLSK